MSEETKEKVGPTPGPWETREYKRIPPQVWTDAGKHVNRVVATLNPDLPAIANARLIAAAPDLLAACRKMVEASTDSDPSAWEAGVDACVAAIAKATGEEA